jgi:hypothetical protein
MDASIIALAVYTTLIIVIGIYSSWEQAAIIGAAICLAPLLLVPTAYIEFLKKVLLDLEVFKITNFTYLLVFTGIVVAYAFNAWVRSIFVIIFILLIAWKLGFITGQEVKQVASAIGK